MAQKWKNLDQHITKMSHIDPSIRPTCAEVLKENNWSITRNEIEKFKLYEALDNYPDHIIKRYLKSRLSLLKRSVEPLNEENEYLFDVSLLLLRSFQAKFIKFHYRSWIF